MSRVRIILSFMALAVAAVPTTASAGVIFTVKCNTGGDALGWSVAADGDWNGDGFNDVAIGIPCVHEGETVRTGKVQIYSGRDGRLLYKKKGKQSNEWFGHSVAWVKDMDGDGRDELMIGAPGYDRVLKVGDPGFPGELKDAGRVKILRKKKPRTFRKLKGEVKEAGFGAKVASVGDINGDGKGDIAISAPEDLVAAGGRKGRLYIFSGKPKGALLDVLEGETAAAKFGVSVAGGLDMTGDGMSDIVAGSGEVDYLGVNKTGHIVGFAAPAPITPFVDVHGAKTDEMGTGLALTEDHDGDGLADFIVGSPGADDLGINRHGTVTLYSSDGAQVIWSIADPTPEDGGEFGTTVADIGDVSGDGVSDFAVGAIGADFRDLVNNITRKDVGRVHAISGVDGAVLWTVHGNFSGGRLGFSLSGGVDWNKDGVGDVAVGAIGAAPADRRGAGSLRILSGLNGDPLKSFSGRRGLETRIYVCGREPGDNAWLSAFDVNGNKRELNAPIFPDKDFGDFSVAVLDDRDLGSAGFPLPGDVKVVAGTGPTASDSDVVVFDAGLDNVMLDEFAAFPDIPGVGANVGAGRFIFDEPAKIVAAQAASPDGNVLVRIFGTLSDGTSWFSIGQFLAYKKSDKTGGGTPIDANGATVTVGNVTGDKTPEIITGTVSGVPMVRVFTLEGVLLYQFLAYDPVDFSGVSIATVDLDASGGRAEILTVPRLGEARVRAWRDGGLEYTPPGASEPLSFNAYPTFVTQGALIAAADVDLDGKPEILTIPRAGSGPVIKAFEVDGTPVAAYSEFAAFLLHGGALAATDTFVRY